MGENKLLCVKNLRISFRENNNYIEVVRGVDFDIREGEIVGILGESGSGKTVSSSAITGLIDSEEGRINHGEIIFNGKDLLKLKERELRKLRGREISYIFQNPGEALNPYKKVGEQIKEVLKTHKMKYSKAMVIEAMEDVGIARAETVYEMYPWQLSGGLCQRVMIAMGIICRPKLLIADEPTSSIDASLRKKILELLKEINKKYGVTIIIITHDFDVAKYLCDNIYIMYGGLVMENGSMEDVLNNPKHPYTRELLRCVKSLDNMEDTLYSLEGRPPNPREFKKECPFYPRCKVKENRCENSIPKIVELKGRKVRCVNEG